MDLDEARRQIDDLDDRILALLEERAAVVENVAAAKARAGVAFYDPERERAVLDRLAAKASGRFPPEAIRAVYREVMSACLSLQRPTSVGFLGPVGTFTHVAARSLFGLAAGYVEAQTIDGVFDAVRRDACAYGVVPFENSTEGSVTHAADALLEGGMFLRRELVLPVEHCLLSNVPGLSGVERVYSHPQALGQCRGWLAKNLPSARLIPSDSTAAAAPEAARDPAGASIGSALPEATLGLRVACVGIQDRADNATRFVVIAKEDAPRTGDDKTTVAFATRDGKGALRQALEAFDEAGVNLLHIQSRPSRAHAWEYVFLVDLEGHRLDPPVASALEALAARAGTVTMLGSYPRHRPRPVG